jgi:sugar phosphate isomerase/epimerase
VAAALCLKARPTATQLADRLRPVDGVWPDGIELYLAAADLADIDRMAKNVEAAHVPNGFGLLIEGPVDSLDGQDFDITRDSEADAEVVRRLARLARRIGARAVNIHVIAPSPDLSRLTLECRKALLEMALPFLRTFVEQVQATGAVPTVEHMPLVLRMRRADFAFSPIGMASADLLWLCEQVPGLRVLVDTSHAALYLNARAAEPDPTFPWSERVLAFVRELPPEPPDVLGYMQAFRANLENAQISNASGLLGEGLSYAEGDVDLDECVRWLSANTRHIVTETLEPDNDDAVFMRDALRRARRALA